MSETASTMTCLQVDTTAKGLLSLAFCEVTSTCERIPKCCLAPKSTNQRRPQSTSFTVSQIVCRDYRIQAVGKANGLLGAKGKSNGSDNQAATATPS